MAATRKPTPSQVIFQLSLIDFEEPLRQHGLEIGDLSENNIATLEKNFDRACDWREAINSAVSYLAREKAGESH